MDITLPCWSHQLPQCFLKLIKVFAQGTWPLHQRKGALSGAYSPALTRALAESVFRRTMARLSSSLILSQVYEDAWETRPWLYHFGLQYTDGPLGHLTSSSLGRNGHRVKVFATLFLRPLKNKKLWAWKTLFKARGHELYTTNLDGLDPSSWRILNEPLSIILSLYNPQPLQRFLPTFTRTKRRTMNPSMR